MPLFRKLLKKFLLVAGGVFVGLLLAEGLLRLGGYSSGNFYRRDDVVGVALRPGAEGWWTKEGRDYVRINSDGLRDREHSFTKPSNTFRIAILGDSYAEALQLPTQKAFWAVMESKLRSCTVANQNIEVINFGVSGYGAAQELLTLREKVWKYDPDLVLLAVTTGNDVSDDSRSLKEVPDIPYFVLSNGNLVLDNSFRNNWTVRWHRSTFGHVWDWTINRSLAVQAIRESINGLSGKYQRWRDPKGSVSKESGLFDAVYHEPREPAWRDAWLVTEALIAEMSREVRNRDRQFVVVTLSNPPQVNPDPKLRSEFMQREGINDLFYPDRRILTLCEREGIQVLVLAPFLQSYAEQHHVFLHGFDQNIGAGHWNEQGHAMAGELIANWLCRLPR